MVMVMVMDTKQMMPFLPFRPYLGDQIFSSMSITSVIEVESLELE